MSKVYYKKSIIYTKRDEKNKKSQNKILAPKAMKKLTIFS